MRIPTTHSASFALAVVLATLAILPACSINVKKSKDGEDKNVDIRTPVGGIHVSKDAGARDTGLPIYPGAREKEKGSDGDTNNANVNISSSFFGVKVVAVEFLSDDPPDKVASFYKDQLKKYGGVLECHTSNPHKDAGDVDVKIGNQSKEKGDRLTCEHEGGTTVELKVGTKDNQHIVSISPKDKGTDFALVYVQTRGEHKDTI
jgi:hypothetical protein